MAVFTSVEHGKDGRGRRVDGANDRATRLGQLTQDRDDLFGLQEARKGESAIGLR